MKKCIAFSLLFFYLVNFAGILLYNFPLDRLRNCSEKCVSALEDTSKTGDTTNNCCQSTKFSDKLLKLHHTTPSGKIKFSFGPSQTALLVASHEMPWGDKSLTRPLKAVQPVTSVTPIFLKNCVLRL